MFLEEKHEANLFFPLFVHDGLDRIESYAICKSMESGPTVCMIFVEWIGDSNIMFHGSDFIRAFFLNSDLKK